MTALITSDFHLSSNPRDRYRHEFVGKTLPALVLQHKSDQLIILGDLTNEKDNHSAELVNEVVGYLYQLAQRCPVIILRGNHDCIDPTKPFFQFVSAIPNITWHTYPADVGLKGLGRCLFLPHTRNYKKDWGMVAASKNNNYNWIFAHNTFEGADAGHGRRLSGIPTNVFPRDATVISGDIHIPQKLDQITYVGAPYTVIFGDTYQPRLLEIGLTPKGKPQMQSISFYSTRKVVIDIKDTDSLPDIDLVAGTLLKLRVHLKADDYSKWSEIQTKVRKWGENYRCVVCMIQPVKVSKSIKLKRRKITVQSDRELLETYSKRLGVASNTLKTGLWIMDKI